MKVSIFTNINGHVEILSFFFSVTDDRRRGFLGVFVVPGFRLFFTRKTANLGGWVSSEYPSIVGLKDILILCSTLVSFSMCYLTSHSRTLLCVEFLCA